VAIATGLAECGAFAKVPAMNTDSDIAALARLIQQSRRAVVFTGAGISTESGIPDFRSPGGIWTQMAPIYFDDFLASETARRETWRRRFAMQDQFGNAEPNRGHRAVDALVRRGKVSAVITQNIDGLHQASGIPPDRVIELHGNTTYATCLDCGQRYEIADLRVAFERDGDVPPCDACLGHVKTATVSFGQAMPIVAMRRAEDETLAADLFIVLGSSLVVYPAAGFPEIAKRNGAALAIVNREPTPLDRLADLVIHRGIGDVMGGAVGVN
jgi:NAD-dependent deacetylase